MPRPAALVVCPSRWIVMALVVLGALGAARPAAAQGWVDVTPSVPGPAVTSDTASMVYDPVRQKMLMFRVVASGSQCQNQDLFCYELGPNGWSQVATQSLGVGQSSLCSIGTKATWDAVSAKVVVIVGLGSFFGSTFYTWDGLVFSPAQIIFGLGTSRALSCWDPVRNYTVVLTLDTPRTATIVPGVSNATSQSVAYMPQLANIFGSGVSGDEYMFFDPGAGRVTVVYMASYPGANVRVCFQWTGASWLQVYPPSVPLYTSAMQVSPALGAAFGVSFYDPALGWQPRAFHANNGAFQQVVLTSYPSLRRKHLMAFDSSRGVFVLHGGDVTSVLSDTWEYTPGPGAAYSTFGAGCLGSRGVPTLLPQSNTLPRVNTPFTVQADDLPLTGPAFLFFGFSNTNYGPTPLPFNLAPVGAPGCNLYVSGDLLFGFPNVLGVGTWTFNVPNQPGVTFFQQAFAFDPPANSLGLTVTNGGQGTVGN